MNQISTVSQGAASIRFRTLGTGPPLLLIHGGLVDSRAWAPQEVMAEQVNLILPDTRGLGRSQGPLNSLVATDLVSDVVAVLDSCDLESAHVLGFSVGGVVAQGLASAFPQRVRSLTLVSTAAGGLVPPEDTAGKQSVHAHVRRAFSPAYLAGHDDQLTPYLAMASENERAGGAAVRSIIAQPPDIGALGRISCPTLVMHAREDQAIALEHALELRRLIPLARMEVIEGCGHTIAIEKAREFNALVLSFVAEVEATRSQGMNP